MTRTMIMVAFVTLLTTSLAGIAFADIVSPDSSSVTVAFTKTYSGNYQNGQPYDYVTVCPTGDGETFASAGITITVTLKNSSGQPLAGVPAQQVVLSSGAPLCVCPGGNAADAATDANGKTTFTGTMRAGGCSSGLDVFADGVFLRHTAVKVNSVDSGVSSPCFTDASDLAAFKTKIGQPVHYDICWDYNEDGIIDSSDLAFFATMIGHNCH